MEENGKANWHFNPNEEINDDKPAAQAPAEVSWQAAEFIEHPHPPSWYAGLMLGVTGLSVVIYFLTRDVIATITIPIMGIIIAMFVKHKPGIASYEINSTGLRINQKNYPYSSYKSFSVYREGQLSSVNLMPTKRLMPTLTAYFEPAEEEKITSALGNHLPMQEHKLDSIDKLTRRFRI